MDSSSLSSLSSRENIWSSTDRSTSSEEESDSVAGDSEGEPNGSDSEAEEINLVPQVLDLTFFDFPLHQHTQHTLGEFFRDVTYKHFKHNHSSKIHFDDSLETLSKFMPQPNLVPSSKFKFMKVINNISPQNGIYIKHVICSNMVCQAYLGRNINVVQCNVCHSTDLCIFIENPIEVLLKFMLEKRDLAQILENTEEFRQDDGMIRDIKDGRKYREIPRTSIYDITLVVNTDGVPISNSSKSQIWPLFNTIVEVPAKHRNKYLVMPGLFCGLYKPDLSSFLEPYINKLAILATEGFRWTHPVTNIIHVSKVFAPIVVADAQARAPLMNIIQNNGYHGCNKCEQAGMRCEHVLNKRMHVYDHKDPPARLRTQRRMFRQAALATPKNAKVGVKGHCCFSVIPYFDVACAFVTEYQHAVLLGVVRRLTQLFFDPKNRDTNYYLGRHKVALNAKLKSIKPPTYISRLPRKIDTLVDWKASEFLHWMLYYFLLCVEDVWPPQNKEHWMYLVGGMNILMGDCISQDSINLAESMLDLFVMKAAQLYGREQLTFNMHSLLHLADCVRDWGPLHAISTFGFESENGILKSMIHGTNQTTVEICSTVEIVNSLHILNTYKVNEFQESQVLGARISLNIFPHYILNFLHGVYMENMHDTNYYLRARVERMFYTSCFYTRNKKRDNSIVLYSETEYGCIQCFAVTNNPRSIQCVLKRVEIVNCKFSLHTLDYELPHILRYNVTEDLIIINMEQLNHTVVKLNGELICIPPNFVEIHL
jgi:hypothetical protein